MDGGFGQCQEGPAPWDGAEKDRDVKRRIAKNRTLTRRSAPPSPEGRGKNQGHTGLRTRRNAPPAHATPHEMDVQTSGHPKYLRNCCSAVYSEANGTREQGDDPTARAGPVRPPP